MRISLNNDVYAFSFFIYSLHKRLTHSPLTTRYLVVYGVRVQKFYPVKPAMSFSTYFSTISATNRIFLEMNELIALTRNSLSFSLRSVITVNTQSSRDNSPCFASQISCRGNEHRLRRWYTYLFVARPVLLPEVHTLRMILLHRTDRWAQSVFLSVTKFFFLPFLSFLSSLFSATPTIVYKLLTSGYIF